MHYIHGFTSQDLTKALTKYEAKYTKEEFRKQIQEDHELDPDGFKTDTIMVGNDDVFIVIGTHILRRLRERTFMAQDAVLDTIKNLLNNQAVAAAIMSHPIMYDEETDRVIDFQDDGITSTAVVDTVSGIVVVFEAGFTFIRPKTLWRIADHYMVRDDAAPIQIEKDGSVIADPLKVTGVTISKHRANELRNL